MGRVLASTGTSAQAVAHVYRPQYLYCDPWVQFSRSGETKMTAVGFEPTQLVLVELESTPLDHSGKLSVRSGGCEQVVVQSMLAHTQVHASWL